MGQALLKRDYMASMLLQLHIIHHNVLERPFNKISSKTSQNYQLILQILYSEHSETKIIKAIEVSSQQLLFINITMLDLTFSVDIFRSQTSENRFGQRPNDVSRQMCVVEGNWEGAFF